MQAKRLERLQIGIFGKVNSGKSTLLNALTSQEVALVSEEKGTTTDPVCKAMEINGIGPVMFIDTAGFDDEGRLGTLRLEKTKEVTKKTDMAIVIFADADVEESLSWVNKLREQNVKVIIVVNDMENNNAEEIVARIPEQVIILNALKKRNIEELKEKLIEVAQGECEKEPEIIGELAKESDVVMLVMPQDKQAPKGRLILPQSQTIRELLDKKCIIISCTTDKIDETLKALNKAPSLIICDSQVLKTVHDKKPKESKLTSFSILFAAYKGDLETFLAGAKAIDSLTESSQVLIAEACTHAPLSEDIGREKIPNMLKKHTSLVTVVSGSDFPDDLTKYALIIHCGACMFNRKHVLSRIEQAKRQGVPITNYGIAIAHLQGINLLDLGLLHK